jgi:hypothetical protein
VNRVEPAIHEDATERHSSSSRHRTGTPESGDREARGRREAVEQRDDPVVPAGLVADRPDEVRDDGESVVDPEGSLGKVLGTQVVEQRHDTRPGSAGRVLQLAVERPRVVRRHVADVVHAREPARHELLGRGSEGVGDLLRRRVPESLVEAREVAELENLCQGPDGHLAVVLVSEVGHEGLVGAVATGGDTFQPLGVLARSCRPPRPVQLVRDERGDERVRIEVGEGTSAAEHVAHAHASRHLDPLDAVEDEQAQTPIEVEHLGDVRDGGPGSVAVFDRRSDVPALVDVTFRAQERVEVAGQAVAADRAEKRDRPLPRLDVDAPGGQPLHLLVQGGPRLRVPDHAPPSPQRKSARCLTATG